MDSRRSIQAEGFSHGKLPIPAASRIGPFIASGNIFGFDYEKGTHPDAAEEQAAIMFGHLKRIVEAAGATLEDVLKVTVYVRNDSVRAAVDPEWVKAFPNPDSRPARQTMVLDPMPGNRLIACDILAVAREG